ncbi:xylose isomerase [Streptomyces solincola]|uniref:Xylose isomerase n=1 Tax=Streptomyces solincola TaxID=2100817 RepID=A0A2S9Q1X7_9ACTN|nr:metabolite traffic protein EboE [Streptomyces solincola]PRH80669.1 xylose isomerase [Streptomyces solincola]
MRFRHPDGSTVHVSYCTNVHPAEDLRGVRRLLREYAEPVRRRLGRDRLGIGLWLARDAVCDLRGDPRALNALRAELGDRGLEVVTLNGFPYRGFGDDVVKHRVYRPDWTERARLDHTVALARVLAALLPEDVTEGSVSTLPLAWRHPPFGPERSRAARTALEELAGHLDVLRSETGRTIRIGLEPEPGCVVETTADAVAALTGPGAPPLEHIGVCLDTCHVATQFEEPDAAVDGLLAAGVPIVKAQLSAALHAQEPHRPEVRRALAAFAEPRYLHQTRTRTGDGAVRGADDLQEALSDGGLPREAPWRCHFHVPLHAAPQPPLSSTTDVLGTTLARLVGGPAPLTRHLEVETYTWQVLPAEHRPRDRGLLTDGIAAELAWVHDLLLDLGLKETG